MKRLVVLSCLIVLLATPALWAKPEARKFVQDLLDAEGKR